MDIDDDVNEEEEQYLAGVSAEDCHEDMVTYGHKQDAFRKAVEHTRVENLRIDCKDPFTRTTTLRRLRISDYASRLRRDCSTNDLLTMFKNKLQLDKLEVIVQTD